MIWLPVVHGVLPDNGESARGALHCKVCRTLVAVWPSLPLLHLPSRFKGTPTPSALEALRVIVVEAVLDGLARNRLAARATPLAHLLYVASGAHEVVVVIVELAVDEPVVAEDALETLGVPAPSVVAEEGHGLADAFLALVALGHGLHALAAHQGVVHLEVLAVLEVLAAPVAHKARVMPALVLDGHLLVPEAYGLGALVAEDCVL